MDGCTVLRGVYALKVEPSQTVLGFAGSDAKMSTRLS